MTLVLQPSNYENTVPTSPRRSWIFLDAGDTFIYAFPTFYEAIRDCWRALGKDIELSGIQEFVAYYLKQNSRAVITTQAQFVDYFRSLYRETLRFLHFPGDISAFEAVLWDEWLSGKRLRLFDDAAYALQELRQAGFHLGVVSNWDNTLEPVLKRLKVDAWFELIMASCQVGIAKPDPGIFQLALAQAGTTAENSWFLGDQVDVDILPAKAMGMKTILVDYYLKHRQNREADFRVPCLSEALRVIRENDSSR